MNGLARLRSDRPVIGALQTLADAAVTDLAISLGFDFVILDREHGGRDEAIHRACLARIGASAAFSAVRLAPDDDDDTAARYVAQGVDAILVPDVRSPEDASRIARRARLARAEAPPLLLMMIESPEGVAQAADIAGTAGVAGLVIGPNDLSAQLGAPGDFESDDYVSALHDVERAGADARVILGTKPHGAMTCADLAARGYRFLMVSADILALGEAMAAKAWSARHELEAWQ